MKEELVRLQKFIANKGFCSRREAETWIEEGRVTVNGKTPQLGDKIDPNKDSVCIDGSKINQKIEQPNVTLIMNKPKGYLCSAKDPHYDRTIYNLLPKRYQGLRLIYAGRLDKDSTGLLILTTDGNLANKLTHPSNNVNKIYHVRVNKVFNQELIPKLLAGVENEGEFLQAQKVYPFTKGPQANNYIEVHLNHGKKREIRRLLEHFGYFVTELKRVQIGSYKMKGIPSGSVREIDQKTIAKLFR